MNEQRKRPVVLRVIGLFAVLFATVAGYTALDMRQAKAMAVDACGRAAQGTLLEELLPLFPEKDFRIIRGQDRTIVVPRKGMGRFNCTVSHDGLKATGASVNFVD